jgi:hypothetical protein
MKILINVVYQRVFPYIPSTRGLSHFDKTYELPDFLRYVNFFIKKQVQCKYEDIYFRNSFKEDIV